MPSGNGDSPAVETEMSHMSTPLMSPTEPSHLAVSPYNLPPLQISTPHSGSISSPKAHGGRILPYFDTRARPQCPSLLVPYDNQLYALPLVSLRATVEVNVSTAFVKIVGEWINIAAFKSDCLFTLPTKGVVNAVSVKINTRRVDTVVIPTSDAHDLPRPSTQRPPSIDAYEVGQLPPMAYEEYIPDLFRLPIANVPSGDTIVITVVYIDPLPFIDCQYVYTLPLEFNGNLLAAGKRMKDVLSVTAIINSVSRQTQWQCPSHDVNIVSQGEYRLELKVADWKPKNRMLGSIGATVLENSHGVDASNEQQVDFVLRYNMSSDDIMPTIIKQINASHSEDPIETDGNFLLFVTPPSIDRVLTFFSRHIIFLLDRSGSMSGEPYAEATRALSVGLSNLKADDMFTVVVFDHSQDFFNFNLVSVTPHSVAAAATWIKSKQPRRGGTDIYTPLEWALGILEGKSRSSESQPGASVLPFVVLLTDGCVLNEREICRLASRKMLNSRMLTFGIGQYCNWFFLKMLAQIGRGVSDIVVYREKIYSQMLVLLSSASVPILSSISLEMSGIASAELYPFPIPDLYIGSPLNISGRYVGKMPNTLVLTGKKANGATVRIPITPRTSDVIPVDRVYLKQRIDLLTARAWLEESKVLEKEVIDLSCAESMPSAYTSLVSYESQADSELDNALDQSLSAMHRIGNASALHWLSHRKRMAAIAIGSTAVVVGAVAFSFGDAGASILNMPVAGDIFNTSDSNCCCCCCDATPCESADAGCTDCLQC